MMKKWVAMGVLCAVTGGVQAADDLDSIGALVQGEFRDLSEDLGAALSYKAIAPAEPLGITGFDVGIEVSSTALDNDAAFNKACSGCDISNLYIPKLHLHKGLPLNLDVGLMYSSVPNSNIKLTGVELRYAFIEGGVAMPAVAVRGTYSKISGVDELDFNTRGLELTVSKGFAMLTPYAGVGTNWVTSTPSASTGLQEEKFTQSKYYVGANMNLGLMNIAVEADKTGGAQTISAKLGLRF
jgi:hypothetical protein